MTENEKTAYFHVQKGKIDSSATLAKKMGGISRQRAHVILQSLQEKGLVDFEPSRWRAK